MFTLSMHWVSNGKCVQTQTTTDAENATSTDLLALWRSLDDIEQTKQTIQATIGKICEMKGIDPSTVFGPPRLVTLDFYPLGLPQPLRMSRNP